MPITDAQKSTYAQHAVPQNIMDVEFKLIGDLTMRQFVYLVVFGVAAYIVGNSFVGLFKWPFTISLILIGLSLAFVPIQERGMDEWVVNFIRAMYAPTQRLWKKDAELPTAFTQGSLAVVRQEMITLAPTSSRRKLEEYLHTQGQGVQEDPLDIPENAYLEKVKNAFADVTTTEPPPTMQSYSADTAGVAATGQQVQVQPQPEPEKAEVKQQAEAAQPAPPEKHEFKPFTPQTSAEEKPKEAEKEQPKEEVKTVAPPKPRPAPAVQRSTKPIKRTYTHKSFESAPAEGTHVGRRFTSMLPSEGTLILPVRGEMVLQTSEEQNIEEDINSRTEQLRHLLDQIKGDEQFKGIVAAGPNVPQDESSKQKINEAEDVVKQVKAENEKLSNEIQKLKSELEGSQEPDEQKQQKAELIKKLESEKSQANQDYSALQKQVHELQMRLKEQDDARKQPSGPQKAEAQYAQMAPITSEPNILSGVLRNSEGNPIEASVLLIKNEKGEAVRAVKTNSLGQFSISTALTNGMYTLEVGTKAEGLTFDIITVDVKGEVIPPIEIKGRPV